MSDNKTSRKLNNIVKNLNKIEEKISNILPEEDIERSQEKMLGKQKKKLELKAKYFKTVKNELSNNEIAIIFFYKIIEESENKKYRLSYLLEVKSDKLRI